MGLAITDFASVRLPNVGQHLCVSNTSFSNFWWCRCCCWQRRRVGHTSMLAHMCDMTRESTVRVGDGCVVTDLVRDAPLHVTRFFRHQDPHAFGPRKLRIWRQFGILFVLNIVFARIVSSSASGSSNVEASVKDIHPSWASCSSVLMSTRFVLTRCFPITLQNLGHELFELRCR